MHPFYLISVVTGQELKLFKHTKLSVVAHLNDMPPTQHDTNSFQVDLSLAQVRLDQGLTLSEK